MYLTKADEHGVKIVKHFKGGLNPSSLHQLQFNGTHLGHTVKAGLICAIIALTVCLFYMHKLSFQTYIYEQSVSFSRKPLLSADLSLPSEDITSTETKK